MGPPAVAPDGSLLGGTPGGGPGLPAGGPTPRGTLGGVPPGDPPQGEPPQDPPEGDFPRGVPLGVPPRTIAIIAVSELHIEAEIFVDGFAVFADAFFKKVCLPIHGDGYHEWEWVAAFVIERLSNKLFAKAVRDKTNVL